MKVDRVNKSELSQKGVKMSSQDRDGVELESQFILRLPEGPAEELREVIRNGNLNLKDRLRLKLDNDLRRGTFYFDHHVFPAKLVDLPCVMESHKTIDNRNMYKTADICQILKCMEEEEPEEEPKPQKKSNSFKVDKRFLYPHGITAPLKSVRKRRFRKTLRKKQYSDQPEIEKEVRRLLRADYEAGHIRWEVIDDEQDDKVREGGGPSKDSVLMQGSQTNENPGPAEDRLEGSLDTLINAEHIFGEDVSDSEADDEDIIQGGELDDESRLSMDDDSQSRQSDSMTSSSQMQSDGNKSFATSFKDLFVSPSPGSSVDSPIPSTPTSSTHGKSPEKSHKGGPASRPGSSSGLSSMSKDDLQSQLNDLRNQLTEISARRQNRETELSSMDNVALRNRLESVLKQIVNEQKDKERQIREIEAMLNQ
ncbi:unnamed protein product [Allacma fusca]|uniref:TAFII55 protein conserved region domain-containing protein n=1 Tax=Allacma fusca TaxID=39272 RepID=A0A8J2JU74_9HEXA|nr:unnamed protein product [Allacma fusca]